MMTDLAVVANYANDYSIYLILHPICACVGLLLYGMYTGIGNTASIRNMMFVAVIFFYICQKILMSYLGNDGIWLTYNLTYLLESIILILYLPSCCCRRRRGRWPGCATRSRIRGWTAQTARWPANCGGPTRRCSS